MYTKTKTYDIIIKYSDIRNKSRKDGLYLKRLISVCLILCFVVSFSACSNQMNPAENALIAIKNMDMDAFFSCMTADSETALSRIRGMYDTDISTDERETLRSLYGLIRYTMGEEIEGADRTKTVSVSVKLPDMARVKTLAEKKILVSASTANDAVSEMLASGEIEKNYMLEAVWTIKLNEEDGAWRIDYADKANEAFVADLYLSEMFAFFAQY